MEARSIQEYERLEKYYWWFVGRRKIIEKVISINFSGRHLNILDWGCGPGGNFGFLSNYGKVIGVDASDEAVRACREKGITNIEQANTLDEFKSDYQFDLITNFDVLEHIADDEKFLQRLKFFLKHRGYVLVTVPAYQFLWTQLDVVLGHQRRYTRGEIMAKFKRNGYHVISASYFVFFISPAFIAYRLFEKLWYKCHHNLSASLNDSVVEFPAVINWLFTQTLFWEATLLRYVRLPFGTSIIVLAQSNCS